MYRHDDGLVFRYEGGEITPGISDLTVGLLFAEAIEAAEEHYDFRLSPEGRNPDRDPLEDAARRERHETICAQSLAGFAITAETASGLSLVERLEDAPRYGGFCLFAAELEPIGDMISPRWLDARRHVPRLVLENGKRVTRIRGAILKKVREEQAYYASLATDQTEEPPTLEIAS